MIKTYLIIAWRSIRKSPFLSGLNIIGLSIGIAFTLLIGAYAWMELGVNRDLRDAGQQYILQSRWKNPDMGLELTTPGPLAKALREEYPGLVRNYYRWDGVTSNVSKGDRVFREGLQLGDSTLLSMYGFQLVDGVADKALDAPFTAVISEAKAIKFFGRREVVGQTLTIENFSGQKQPFTITGVLRQLPRNSITTLNTDNENGFFIGPRSINWFGRDLENWSNVYIVGYVEFQPGVRPEALAGPIGQLLKKYAPALAPAVQPYAVSLPDFYRNYQGGLVRKMIYTVSGIAAFLLLMALINFINMTISRYSGRLREIGVRKVIGGLRHQLVTQLLTESWLLALLATIVALGLYQLGRPLFFSLLGTELPSVFDVPARFYLLPVALSLVIGLMAGIYPALSFSRVGVIDSLRNRLRSVREKALLRKSLLALQVGVAALVLTAAIIVSQQVRLFYEKDLGYDRDYVVSAQVPRNWTREGVQHMLSVREGFSTLPDVSSASLSYQVPDGTVSGQFPVYGAGSDSSQAIAAENLITDERYLETFGIGLAAGRYFRGLADSSSILINETAARALGYSDPAAAIGKNLIIAGQAPVPVIGVVKDFHFGSMRDPIKPEVFFHVGGTPIYRTMSFKIRPGSIDRALAGLQKKWAELLPGAAFEYRFMDETIARLYRSELQLKKATQVATVLALLIVLLGLIGMVSISVQKRIKEIGVRKVLGAPFSGIAALFLRDFLPMVILGSLVSIPVSWYLMRQWLNDYTYRIALTPLPFLLTLLALGLLTTALILLQIARAARLNPSISLRNE